MTGNAAPKRIIIIGTGGNCTDILDTMLDINDARGTPVYECIGFLDDNPARRNSLYFGLKVIGTLNDAANFSECSFVFGIGSPLNFRKRHEILARTGLSEERFETVIHPTASVSRMAHIGTGSVIFQNVTITSNAMIGQNVYILPNSVISHDVHIGDFTCIAGGVCLSGNVEIGSSCYIGTNVSVREGTKIGEGSLVGMGSVVVKDVQPNSMVFGNPAAPRDLSLTTR